MSQTARNRIHTGAMVISHISLVFYLLILMLKTVSLTGYGAGYLRVQGERVLPLLRILMTALLAEKLMLLADKDLATGGTIEKLPGK